MFRRMVIEDALEFASTANDRTGWSRSVPHCVIGQFLFQMRWNVRNDQGVIAFVSQFKHVTNSMNLGDQGGFIRWNAKTGAQPPCTERVFQSLHQRVNAFSGSRFGKLSILLNTIRVCLPKASSSLTTASTASICSSTRAWLRSTI